MNPKMRTFSGVISLIVMSSFCLLQTHSYALAEVVTPELQTPSKPSKSFTVIGLVSYIDSSIIKMEKANGSDGTKNTNYTVNYYSPKIENQLYEDLGVMDIAIGNKIIAQGSLVDGAIVAKRIIVFSHTSVLDELLKENATTTASSTETVGTSTEDVASSTEEGGSNTAPLIDTGTSTASSTEQNGTSTPDTITGSGTDPVIENTSSSTPDVMTTSTESTSTEEVLTPATTTIPTTDTPTNPNDKNGDAKPTTDTPDPISSGSPIISTPRDESTLAPETIPEPEPVPPIPEPTPPPADVVVQI